MIKIQWWEPDILYFITMRLILVPNYMLWQCSLYKDLILAFATILSKNKSIFFYMYVCPNTRTHILCLDFISSCDLCLFWLAFRAESAGFGGGEEECVHTTHTHTHAHANLFLHPFPISKYTHPHLVKTDPVFFFPSDTLTQAKTHPLTSLSYLKLVQTHTCTDAHIRTDP